MDLTKYAIGIDTWEGSLDIDEATLLNAGVNFIFIRMNDTQGGLHGDGLYVGQWEQSACFSRAPYYVVSPWVLAKYQVEYILDHMLDDCKLISLDVELKPGYGATPKSYSILVNDIIKGIRAKGINPIIYTGAWFLEYVNPWPKDVLYWWAAYPLSVYPAKSVQISWDEAKKKLAALDWIGNLAPAEIAVWQCTGDRWKLPGCAGRAMDVNLAPWTAMAKLWTAPKPRRWYSFLPWVRK